MTSTLNKEGVTPGSDTDPEGKTTVSDREVQDLVDTIASTLQVGVSLDDMSGHLLAYSAHRGAVDDARIRALLQREVPSDVRAWEMQHGVRTTAEPVVIPRNPALGMLARIC